MIDRAYTVREIDQLRDVVERMMTFGTTYFPPGCGGRQGCGPSSKSLEERIRTYMVAGIVAADTLKEDETRGSTPKISP